MMSNHAGRLELLAPGGSFAGVKAAFMAGADAVYMGGDRFSARAYAQSVSEAGSLEAAMDYAHLHDRKLYLTLNTLLKEEELKSELYDYVKPLYERGLDALLVQDLGVLRFLKREFPDLTIHASTQMTVTGAEGAMVLKELGLSRVVAARELSLAELAEIYAKTGMELEAFVHGAICYCYSGQCLFSGVIGGRSGNRGRCAQPCRLPYSLLGADGRPLSNKKEPYLLSLKDMNTLSCLPELVKAGVISFKIEGRMKSPLYTAGIVSIYRKYIDLYLEKGEKGYEIAKKDMLALSEFFDRGGFTRYLDRHNGRDMIALTEKPKTRVPDPALMKETDEKYLNKELKRPVNQFIRVEKGEPLSLTLNCGDFFVTRESAEPVSPAVKRPLTEADVKKQMGKLGQTPFSLGNQEVSLSGDAFLPVQSMNVVRRDAFDALLEEILQSFKRTAPQRVLPCREEREESNRAFRTISVSLMDADGLSQVLSCKEVTDVYLESTGISFDALSGYAKDAHEAGKKLYLLMPRIIRKEARTEWKKSCKGIYESGIDGILFTCLDALGLLWETGCRLPLIADHSFYTFNSESAAFVSELCEGLGLKLLRTAAPLELNEKELAKRGMRDSELLIYGAIPMMVTAGCVRKTTAGCNKKKERLTLIDRKGAAFPTVCHCKYCYNTIYNSVPVYLLDKGQALLKLSVPYVRLSFTTETKKEREEILSDLSAFVKGERLSAPGHMTRGHFTRGVL